MIEESCATKNKLYTVLFKAFPSRPQMSSTVAKMQHA